ncbi:RNA-binding domain-containing protein [Holdemania massiliensis]|uniref:RNA-binding domain-containing protein n=1 Tax=Holdemania massiliensis TaxID=1468449 RepID=UPI001F066216|nr:RNA-binding domain-containing protein [Holdemania massiliensis]MCH1942738.1 putative DNA binding domain-containing protein [Holdemania massiliensis]
MDFIESSKLELKELINSDFKKEIIAFANTDGGEIYVGVNKLGKIVGVENAEKEMERISCMIHDGIHPDLIPYTTIDTLRIDGKDLIHVQISRGGKPPYHLTEKGLKPSGVYVRHGVTSIPASEEMIRDLIRQSDGLTFDKMRSLNQDLTFHYAEAYFIKRSVAFKSENQRSLGLIDADGYYTNTALLLSDQCEHTVKCAVFEGTGKTLFKTRKEFNGSLLKQLEEAYEYITVFNNVHADFVGLERIESFDYPEYALREALLNTLIHRDYNYSGSTIINIFTDRIEFVSLGGLVKGLSTTDILRGVSQSRNMLLAQVFYRLRLVESFGTGIQRILESYQETSLHPEFIPGPSSFITVLPNMNYADILPDTDLSASESKVLNLLAQKREISRSDVEKLLNCSAFPARKLLNSLIAKNKIRVLGNARSTKYVLENNSKK